MNICSNSCHKTMSSKPLDEEPKRQPEDVAPSEPRKKRPLSMQRHVRRTTAPPLPIIAYDYESTPIAEGTPRPVYLTAYGEAPGPAMHFAEEIPDMQALGLMLVNNFLRADLAGTAFVAWNGNRFDAYFTAAALVRNPAF